MSGKSIFEGDPSYWSAEERPYQHRTVIAPYEAEQPPEDPVLIAEAYLALFHYAVALQEAVRRLHCGVVPGEQLQALHELADSRDFEREDAPVITSFLRTCAVSDLQRYHPRTKRERFTLDPRTGKCVPRAKKQHQPQEEKEPKQKKQRKAES